jgi:hypothetical protein
MDTMSVFYTVRDHLLAQNRRAVNDTGMCAYRGKDGTKCAVGCLILDDEYSTDMEGKPVKELWQMGMLPHRLVPYVGLLDRLQGIHDARLVRSWELQLRELEEELLADNCNV